jgi:hypothetical protein
LDFDFANITGPAHSREENFSQLCNRLLVRMYPDAKPVQGSGGDEGVDTFVGEFSGLCDVYQHKFFLQPLRSSQKRQIKHSLDVATSKHRMRTWTLMLPKELTPAEVRWFEALGAQHVGVSLDWWGSTKLRDLLARFPDIARDYSPRATWVTVVVDHTKAVSALTLQELELLLSTTLAAHGYTPPADVLHSVAADIKKRALLRVLIWGPGPGRGPVYDKRLQIRDGLRKLGHTADFSEDVWPQDALFRSGLNLSVAEFLQAADYDYIVCMMSSPGTIGEVHDFARIQRFASKMMICVDVKHREGYSAAGVLRIFEGYNGKLDWFHDPVDVRECHLRTRILDQIEKVSERKQWEIATGLT